MGERKPGRYGLACGLVLLLGATSVEANGRKSGESGKTGTIIGTVSSAGELGKVVVYLENGPSDGRKIGPPPAMIQKHKSFDPDLVVVQVGEKVRFPNVDRVFHNVFSLSKGNEFDLGLYRQGQSKSVHFAHPGVVEVFCNIHPQMIASVLVVENPYYAIVDGAGRYELKAPPGNYKIAAWSPNRERVLHKVKVLAGQVATIDFAIAPARNKKRHLNKDGVPYGRYK